MEKYDVCHQSNYEKDFWKYCKSDLGKEERPDAELDQKLC